MKNATIPSLCVALALTGCATASKDIAPVSVSPLIYESYDCDQLSAELARVHARAAQVGGRLDQAASNDAALTAAGMVLFWPALFFLGGTRQQEAEYARLRGESDAIQQAAIGRRCTLSAPPIPASGEASTPASAGDRLPESSGDGTAMPGAPVSP